MTDQHALIQQLLAALLEAERVIEEATDELMFDHDQRFAPMGAEDVERVYLLLCGPLVQVCEAIRAASGGEA